MRSLVVGKSLWLVAVMLLLMLRRLHGSNRSSAVDLSEYSNSKPDPSDHQHQHMVITINPVVMAKVRQIKCQRPLVCNSSKALAMQHMPNMFLKLFHLLPPGNEAIIDSKNKILMDWTAKADCSSAVNMFFAHMGFSYGLNYTELPHAYRPAYYKHCGAPSICHYLDPSWLRFKMVRNPFDRAVSSFVHIMRHPNIVKLNESVARHWTFHTYLTTLEKISIKRRYYYGLYHAGFQHRAFELFYWQQFNRSFFHHVIHIEDPANDLLLVNQMYAQKKMQKDENGNSRKPPPENQLFHLQRLSHHFVKRSNQSAGYLGDTPWSRIGSDNIPKDYGLFYNAKLRKLAESLFHWDLVLYNYSFPFQEHAWFHKVAI